MIWDSTNNIITIEWLEEKGGKSTHQYFKKSPLRIQLHPTNNDILRAYFKGAQPAWVKRYAKNFKYKTHEVTNAEGKGWWIANWSNYPAEERPLLCPFIKGMIEEWFEKLPEVCQKDKEKLLENIEVVEMNLLYHADVFKESGLHFRPEELLKEHGAMLLHKNLFPKETEVTGDVEPKFWPEYATVVKELMELRAIPEGLEISARIEEDEEEDESFVLELPTVIEEDEVILMEESDEMLEFPSELVVVLPESDDVLELEESETEFITLEQPQQPMVEIQFEDEDDEEFVLQGEDVKNNEELVLQADEQEPEVEEIILDEQSSEPTIIVRNEEHLTPEIEPECLEKSTVAIEQPALTIAVKTSKKEGIIAGQTLLF